MNLIELLLFCIVTLNVIDLNFGETREEIEKWEEYKVMNLIIIISSKNIQPSLFFI